VRMIGTLRWTALAWSVVALLAAVAASSASAAGETFAWGANEFGQLGVGTNTPSDMPLAVTGLAGVRAISAGGKHTIALMADGTVMTWGAGAAGEIGNGTTKDSYVPVAVPGLTDVIQVAAGVNYNLALLSDGTVMAWGVNDKGQLGDGTTVNKTVPVPVKNLTGVTAVSGSKEHSLALLSNGTVMDWGSNRKGELGLGTTTGPETCGPTPCSTVPMAVGGVSNATAISAGESHMLALLSNGTIMAWGGDSYGELGATGAELLEGRKAARSYVPIPDRRISNVTSIAAGNKYSMAILADGHVMAWGRNVYGQLGNGTTTSGADPVTVIGVSGATAIAAGKAVSTALLSNGTVMAWGENTFGQLGNGGFTGPETCVEERPCSRFAEVVSGLAGVAGISLDADGNHTLAFGAPPPVVASVTPTSGPEAGATTVTVSGSGFDEASAVHFGTSEATSFTVESDGSITAVSPPGSGTVDVTVTTPVATSATSSADQYTYLPVPAVSGVSPSSGPAAGGTAVTIAGSGFTQASAVHFGAAEATSFNVESDGSIRAVTPEGTGTVDVTVTTPGGTSPPQAGDLFVYRPVPSVTSVAPTSGPAGGGTTVTIAGSGFTAASAVHFGSAEATSFTVESDGSITAVSPAGTGTVDITVTTPGGTSAKSAADLYKYRPTVTGLSPSSGPEAGGTTVTITGSGFVVGTTGTNFAFGGKRASSVQCSSTTTCTAVSPAHAPGKVDVLATVNKVSSAVNRPGDQFTYLP
jgi:alpha-tubulin suppressor-like RCC1 family protein